MELFTATLFASMLRVASPLIWVAMGTCISHQAGIFNFAVEGLLLFGSFFAVLYTVYTHSAFLSVILCVFTVTFFSLIFAFVVLRWKADPIIAAFGVNLIALGGTAYLLKRCWGRPVVYTLL